MGGQFTRRIEDFKCEHCGAVITGSGYTNHCPKCLWSKHVDVRPGDRASECGGMMEPVDVELKASVYSIMHRCQKCGHTKPNQVSPADDFDQILALSKKV